ncbi:MAG: hypothetical protein ACYDGR_17320, partial [Candidatus Dormibacteria bacterium]
MRTLLRERPLRFGILLLLASLAASGLGVRPLGDANAATPPEVGFSFSPRAAAWLGLDAPTALGSLMQTLTPDIVRLPVYWDAVASQAQGPLDFTSVDSLLEVVRDYNRTQ